MMARNDTVSRTDIQRVLEDFFEQAAWIEPHLGKLSENEQDEIRVEKSLVSQCAKH